MSAADLAKKLKAEEKAAEKKAAEDAKAESIARDKEKGRCIDLIQEVLGSFGMSVEKKWFGGSDYWTLNRGKRCLCSVVLRYESGTMDYSDDYRNVPWSGWRMTVCKGMWSGPHDRNGMGGLSTKEDLENYVAQIMKDYI